MIRAMISRKIDSMERQLGASMEYVRYMLRVSLRAFLKFAKATSVAGYRRAAPADVLDVARLVCMMHEDCGSCVQIEVNMAKKNGVPANVLRAVLDQRPEDLPDELADVYHFAHEVVEHGGGDGPYRERIRQRCGDEALVEVALAMATCRIFPITKRALGYASSCAKVTLEV
jgi:alkylhydroperoxidase family enzyme